MDANQRWAVDGSARIAQTAHEMEDVKAAGIGDPYEFADPNERVPLEAIQYWQDSIAIQGPVINGKAELHLNADGKLVATIQPNDGSPALEVEVDGIPVLANGFAKESAPGTPRGRAGSMSVRRALVALDTELAALAKDPALGDAAARARAELQRLGGDLDGDAGQALAALPADLRKRLSEKRSLELDTLEAQAHFSEMRSHDREHVFYGDEANAITDAQAKTMHRVVIAGTGGTAVSAAEVILSKNQSAHVVMVGKEAPPGLLENGQFKELVKNHLRSASSAGSSK